MGNQFYSKLANIINLNLLSDGINATHIYA